MANNIGINANFIDSSKGRRFVFGNIKFVGEFTLIDFVLMIIFVGITIPFFFIKIALGIVVLIIMFIIFISLIMEVKSLKLYERIWFKLKFIFSTKKININSIISDNDNVYEVMGGFDGSNLSNRDLFKINKEFNDFLESIDGRIKIFKFNSTFRLKEISDNYEKIINSRYTEGIVPSYKINIDEYINRKMPNFYIQFLNIDSDEINVLLSKLNSIFPVIELKSESFKIIKASLFGFSPELEMKSKSISNNDSDFSIGKITFGHNVPDFWLQQLLNNTNVSFSIDIRKPNFKEKEVIKKSIKRWSKSVQNDTFEEIVGKNFFETKNNSESREAKNEIILNNIIGKDEIELINGYVFIEKDKSNPLSFKKQINDINFINYKYANFNIDILEGQQLNLLNEFFNETSYEKNWYPTNSSTISNSVLFQNQSYLDKNGAYIGTINNIFPFVFNSWKDGNAGKHMGILAKTGAGKTILMKKLIIADEVMSNSRQYILDPKNDGFDKVVLDRFGGLSINVYKMPLNPLEINLRLNNDINSLIENKIIEIQEWLFILFKKEINSSSFGINISLFVEQISKFLKNWHLDKKINHSATFFDLNDYLILMELENDYKLILLKLVNGSYSRFNIRNDFLLENKSIVFNLQDVFNISNEELRNSILFLILNKIIDEIYYRQDKNINISLWIDEAGDFFKSEFLTKRLEQLMIKSRSFNTKICWATQNPTDLIDKNNKFLNSIFSNTEHLFIGQLKDSQIGAINEMLVIAENDTLTKAEKEWIGDSSSEFDKGKFLYFNSNQRYRVKSDYNGDFVFKGWNEEWKKKENRR